jgi:hypothetical protein
MNKGTVYKRKDGRWECRISLGKDDNGKRLSKSFYGKTREEAEYKMMIALDHTEERYALTEMTVKELVTEWLYVMKSRIKEAGADPHYAASNFGKCPLEFYTEGSLSIILKEVFG